MKSLILTWIITLLTAHWLDIMIVVLFGAFLIFLWRKGKKDLVKCILYSLVVKAEQALGSKTGPLKYNFVQAAWARMPWILRIAFTPAEIDSFIKDGVQWLKKLLESGNINLLNYAQETVQKQYDVINPDGYAGFTEITEDTE